MPNYSKYETPEDWISVNDRVTEQQQLRDERRRLLIEQELADSADLAESDDYDARRGYSALRQEYASLGGDASTVPPAVRSAPRAAVRKSGSMFDQLREEFPEEYGRTSDAEFVQAIAQASGADLSRVASWYGIQIDAPGFKSSVDRAVGSTLLGVGQAAEDLFGLQDNALKRYGQEVVFTNPSGVNSLQDIVDNPGLALREGAGNLVGYLGPQVGLGLAGKAAAAYGAARTGAAIGGFAGQTALAGLPSYGGVREEQIDAGKNEPTDMLRAAGTAVGVGAVENLFGIQKMLGIGQLGKTTFRDTVRSFGKSPISTAARTTASGAIQEGAEELVQSPMEQWGAYRDPTDPKNVDETVFSGAMGAIGGLVGGGGVGLYRGVQHSQLANEVSPYMVDPAKRSGTDLLAAMEERDYQQYIAPIQADAQDWNQLREGVIPESVAAEMPIDESSPGAEFQWNQPARTKEDIEAAFNAPVGSVGGKTITAFDEYKAAHPEIFGKQKSTKAATPAATAPTTEVSNETARAITLLRAAGLKPSAPRIQIVAEAQKLEAQGVLTRDEVDDVVNRITDSKQYEKVRGNLAEKALAAERAANPPTTREEQRAEVQKMLASLSEEEQAVLTQYTYDKQTFEQIADNLGLKNKQKAQRTFEWAKKKLARKAAEFGVPASKIDEIFPNENNSLQGGADVQTASLAALAQSGAAMHTPGALTDQEKALAETKEEAEPAEVSGNLEEFGDAPVFDEESHLRRGEVEEGAAPVETLTNTYVDHLGIPLKQEDIDDAGVEYDGVASRVGAPLYATLDTATKVRATKAYAAYMDESMKLADFKRTLKDIANEQLDNGKRETSEETTTPDVPQEPSVQREAEPAAEAEVEQGSGEPSIEAEWNAYAAANDFPTWSALSDEQKSRVETAAATGDEQLIGDTVVAVAEELLGIRSEEDSDQAAGQSYIDSDEIRIKQLESKVAEARDEGDTTLLDWASNELSVVRQRLAQRVGVSPLGTPIVWDNDGGALGSKYTASFNHMLTWLANHEVLGWHAKQIPMLRIIDGAAGVMFYDKKTGQISVPVGWLTNPDYNGGKYEHERVRTFLHEVGHFVDIAGIENLYSGNALFKSASTVDAQGLVYRPRGAIAKEALAIFKKGEKHSSTAMALWYPLSEKLDNYFTQAKQKLITADKPVVDVSESIDQEVFAQVFSLYYSAEYKYKSFGNRTAKEMLAEDMPFGYRILGDINEILRKASDSEKAGSVQQGTSTAGSAQKVQPAGSTAARSRNGEGGVKFSQAEGESVSFSRSATELREFLREQMMSPMRFDSIVTVYATEEEATAAGNDLSSAVGNVRGFKTPDGKVGLIASNITRGQELGVFLHEVGVHLGMKKLVGKANMEWLAEQISAWAKKNDGSLESTLAKRVIGHVQGTGPRGTAAGSGYTLVSTFDGVYYEDAKEKAVSPVFADRTEAEDWLFSRDLALTQEEMIAYMVEELVAAGVTAQATGTSHAYQWFRRLWAAAKSALRKLGFRNPDFSGQNLVDLAYGAANLELEGTWHGTAADFRNFDHTYMGSGEGVQAYGWGTYLAQRVGVAKKYWRDGVADKVKTTTKPLTWTRVDTPDDVTMLRAENNFGLEVSVVHVDGFKDWTVVMEHGVVGTFPSEAEAVEYAEFAGTEHPEGSLMRVAVNARDDEFLDWDEPVWKQPAVLARLKEKYSDWGPFDPDWTEEYLGDRAEADTMTGEELYRRIALDMSPQDKQIRDEWGRMVPTDEGWYEGQKAASKYLDSIGIKGIKFLDAASRSKPSYRTYSDRPSLDRVAEDYGYGRSGSDLAGEIENYGADHVIQTWGIDANDARDVRAYEAFLGVGKNITRNLVVFNDKNIVRAMTEVGADPDRIKFSQTMASVAQTLAPAAKTEAGDFWAKMKPKLLTIHQLVDQYGAKLQSLKNYVKTVDSMEQFQQQLAVGAHDIVMNWQKLPKAMQRSLNRVMLDATMWGIHPDKPFTDKLNGHLTEKDKYRYDDLKNRYNALPPDAKATYVGARDYLNGMWKQRSTVFADLVRTSYAKLIARDPDNKAKLVAKQDKLIAEHEKQLASVKGPYFPLLRFGDYLTIGKSKDLAALEAQLADENLVGRAKVEEKILELKKDSKHYAVYASERKSAAEAKAKELELAGFNVKTQLAENHPNALMPFSAVGMDRLRSMFDNQFEKGTANKLDRLLTEMYITSLPEHNALQRQLKRIGVEGAEENSLRAFARAVEQDSFHLSRMKYNSAVSEHLFKVDREAKAAGIEYQHVANNLKDRIDLDFQYQRTPVLSMLGRLSSFWHLGVSPAYLFTNATQPWMIALPQLAGRFGMSKTLGAMKNSWSDAKNMIVQSKKDGAFADVRFDSLPNLDERKMLQSIRNLGQIDITINFDLGNTAETISPAWLKLQKSLAWANHHIEVSNRITTALTAYRLAKVAGMEHDAATDYAYKQVIDTQLDYSNANAAYFMKSQHLGGLNKLIMQFRKYQQGMFYLLAQNAKLAFAGDKQAMKSFGYLMAMQGAFAGLAGVPFMSMALFAAGLGIDDDDPEGDAETQFRNFLADALGPEAARVFYKGLPAMLGMDVSKRIGLGEIWDPTPFYDMKDFNKAKTGKEAVSGALFALAGPAVGTMSNFADAAVLAESGQLNKAAEKMLPKVLADVVRATRYGSEGLTTRAGKPVLGDESFSAGDLTQRALGFAPLTETEHYAANAAKMDTQQAIKDRREKLIAGWARYRMLGDADNVAAMDEAVSNWNAKHPNKGERIDRSALLRAVQERRKSVRTTDAAGVSFRKDERYLKEIDRFAR